MQSHPLTPLHAPHPNPTKDQKKKKNPERECFSTFLQESLEAEKNYYFMAM